MDRKGSPPTGRRKGNCFVCALRCPSPVASTWLRHPQVHDLDSAPVFVQILRNQPAVAVKPSQASLHLRACRRSVVHENEEENFPNRSRSSPSGLRSPASLSDLSGGMGWS